MKAIAILLISTALLASCTTKTPTQTNMADTPAVPVSVEVETMDVTPVIEVDTTDMGPVSPDMDPSTQVDLPTVDEVQLDILPPPVDETQLDILPPPVEEVPAM